MIALPSFHFARRAATCLLLLLCFLLAGCATSKSGAAKTAATKRVKPEKPTAYPEVSDEALESLAHYATGLSLDMQDDSFGALEEYTKAAEKNPREEPLVLEVSRRLLRNKEGKRAVDLLNKAAAEPNASGLVYSWLGLAYASINETNKAVAANRTAIQKLPGQISAYVNLCDLFLAAKQTNEVVNVLNIAGRQTNAPPEFYVNLAEVILRMQAKDVIGPDDAKSRAVAALDKASAANPEDIGLRQRMGDAYLFHGENAKAEKIFEKLFADNPDLPGMRERLINTYFRTDKPKAEKMLQDLRKDAPDDPRPYIFLAQLALDDNRIEEALTYLETALAKSPADQSLWYRVAALKVAVKKPQEALDLLDKAKAKFGQLTFAQEFYTGVALVALEKYQDALARFTSAEVIAKASEPERLNAQFYFQVGSAHERAKDIAEAVKYFRRALALEPDFTEALNYLGYMWAERGENLDEARTMIEKALKQEPKNAAFLDSMAWVLFKQNKPAEALPYMQKAIELEKKPDATLYDHLGDIFAAMNRTGDARDAWQKALKLEPKEEIRKKLGS